MNTFYSVSRTASVIAVAGACVIVAAPAAAQTTANLAVSATVSKNCIVTTTPVTFGAYDPIAANLTNPLTGTGGIVVRCTKGADPTVALSNGGNFQTTRRMISGANFLNYELYRDSGYATLWTTGIALGAAPSNVARTFTVYGRVPGTQDVAAGSYTDTVVATMNF